MKKTDTMGPAERYKALLQQGEAMLVRVLAPHPRAGGDTFQPHGDPGYLAIEGPSGAVYILKVWDAARIEAPGPGVLEREMYRLPGSGPTLEEPPTRRMSRPTAPHPDVAENAALLLDQVGRSLDIIHEVLRKASGGGGAE